MKTRTVLIVGGGTGGHITPGIALYESFKERGAHPLFLGGRKDIKFSSMNDIDAGDLFLYNPPSFTKNPLKIPFFILKFMRAAMRASRIIRKMEVDAVVGMGGYVSAPALFAARWKKTPLFLCEQNTVPGRVTQLFEKHARSVFVTFSETSSYMKNGAKAVHAGNPIRAKVMVDITVREARKAFHLENSPRVILVIGGSQGALRINELMAGLLTGYPDDFRDVGIIWSTGDFSYTRFRDLVQNELNHGAIYISPYIDRVGHAYRAANIAISRSGAGVMMELAAMGVPSIQIPYPFAAMKHQDKNADVFVKEGAALKISDDEATPDRVVKMLRELLNNDGTLSRMAEKTRGLSRRNAGDFIAEKIDLDITGSVKR